MSDSHLKKCPECNGPVRRLVSGGSGLIFKGSGFYLTDYVKKTNPKEKTVSEKNKVSEKKKVSSKVSKKESKKS
jgi:predicted nucleic acid-binding Zn ribbon protein